MIQKALTVYRVNYGRVFEVEKYQLCWSIYFGAINDVLLCQEWSEHAGEVEWSLILLWVHIGHWDSSYDKVVDYDEE